VNSIIAGLPDVLDEVIRETVCNQMSGLLKIMFAKKMFALLKGFNVGIS
jgi:hypothetical protein